MKIQTAMILAALLALAPSVQAQRRSGPPSGQPAATSESPQVEMVRPVFRQEAQRQPPTLNLPSSPILPMTNPIIPITNPVPPVIQYGGVGHPTSVVPQNTSRDRRPDRDDDRRRGNVPVVIVGGPYVGPYVSPEYLYYPYTPPVTVPGQLPGGYQEPEPSVIYVPVPGPATNVAPAVAPAVEEPIYYPEPNIIITPPEPERILQPPALGTTKADVIARYGQPWGTIWARGKETLYFTGGLTLVLEDGKVTQIR